MIKSLIIIIFSIIASILCAKLYNKKVIYLFSPRTRKVFYFLTFMFFICTSISIAVLINIHLFLNNTIINYTIKIEKILIDRLPEILVKGIDLDKITDPTQIYDSLNELINMISGGNDLQVNKFTNDIIIKSIDKTLKPIIKYKRNVTILADNNNIITIGSILNFLAIMTIRYINSIFLKIYIIFFIPLVVYIIITMIIALIKAKRSKTATGKITET